MATSITTSYVGVAAIDYVSKALLEATSLKNGHLTVIPNIKKSYKLQITDLGNIIQADGCDFTPSGVASIIERSLTPVDLKVNFKDCKTIFENHWMADKMRAGAHNSGPSTEFSSWLVSYMQGKVNEGVEKMIWQGDTAGSGGVYATYPFLTSSDGFVKKMTGTASGVDQVAGTTVTSGNVLAEIEKVYAAIPDVVLGAADLKIFVPRQVLRLFQTAIPSTFNANSNFDITKEQPVYYKGLPLVAVDLANNKMIAARTSNLYFGTDLTSDLNEVKVLDFSETDLSDNIGMKMRFSAGVEFAIPSEIVLYS
jgi:hypothetical protein